MPRLKPNLDEIQKYGAMLETTPRAIADVTKGLSEARLRWSPSKKDWSAVEVLAHLRSCEELWSYSIYAMLAENQPTLALVDERRWAKAAQYTTGEFQYSFQVYSLRRTELLRVLKDLPDEAWERTAIIEGRTYSVFSQVRRMALHEIEHIEQIKTVILAGEGVE